MGKKKRRKTAEKMKKKKKRINGAKNKTVPSKGRQMYRNIGCEKIYAARRRRTSYNPARKMLRVSDRRVKSERVRSKRIVVCTCMS